MNEVTVLKSSIFECNRQIAIGEQTLEELIGRRNNMIRQLEILEEVERRMKEKSKKNQK